MSRRVACRVSFSGRRPLGAGARRAVAAWLTEALDEHGSDAAVSIAFVGDDEIRDAHREFFDEDTATDVITFPLESEGEPPPPAGATAPSDPALLGEVWVSVDTAVREAAERGIAARRELALYSLHGVLHLLGYDDIDPEDRRRMRAAERKYMRRIDDAALES